MNPYMELDARICVGRIGAEIREDTAATAARIAARAAVAPRYEFGIHTDEHGVRRIIVRSSDAEDLILLHTRGYFCTGGPVAWARSAAFLRAESDPTIRYYTSAQLGLSDITVQTYLETRMMVAYIPTTWSIHRSRPRECTEEDRMYQYLLLLEPRFLEMEALMFAAIGAAAAPVRRRHALAAFGLHRRRL